MVELNEEGMTSITSEGTIHKLSGKIFMRVGMLKKASLEMVTCIDPPHKYFTVTNLESGYQRNSTHH